MLEGVGEGVLQDEVAQRVVEMGGQSREVWCIWVGPSRSAAVDGPAKTIWLGRGR